LVYIYEKKTVLESGVLCQKDKPDYKECKLCGEHHHGAHEATFPGPCQAGILFRRNSGVPAAAESAGLPAPISRTEQDGRGDGHLHRGKQLAPAA